MNTDVKKPDQFGVFLDTYLQELIATPDDEVLEELDPAAVKAEAISMLDAARAEAGRRRLAVAKKGFTDTRLAGQSVSVSAIEARAFLRQAANDSRYTLAARELNEISDAEAIRLYEQLKRLENESNDDGNDLL